MKNIFTIAIVILFLNGIIFSQSITVNKPGQGVSWCIGKSYQITWVKTGSMDANVKITLRNASDSSLAIIIANPTPNNGSYHWTIPASVGTGSYLMRVKTADNAISFDTRPFQISTCSNSGGTGLNVPGQITGYQKPGLIRRDIRPKIPELRKPDFKVTDVYLDPDFFLRAKIKNIGRTYSGRVQFHYQVNSGSFMTERDRSWKENEEYELITKAKGEGTMGSDKTMISMWADKNNIITEEDENNNLMVKHVHPDYPHPDYIVTGARYHKTSNNQVISPYGPNEYKGIKYSSSGDYFIKVKNIGDTYTGKIRVRVKVLNKRGPGYLTWADKEMTITFQKNEEKEILVQHTWWPWCYVKGSKTTGKGIVEGINNAERKRDNNEWTGEIREK
ncbi:MAG: Ser-Thr-rich GPI-anchored membrane family protein [Acidobacteriota bacterium]